MITSRWRKLTRAPLTQTLKHSKETSQIQLAHECWLTLAAISRWSLINRVMWSSSSISNHSRCSLNSPVKIKNWEMLEDLGANKAETDVRRICFCSYCVIATQRDRQTNKSSSEDSENVEAVEAVTVITGIFLLWENILNVACVILMAWKTFSHTLIVEQFSRDQWKLAQVSTFVSVSSNPRTSFTSLFQFWSFFSPSWSSSLLLYELKPIYRPYRIKTITNYIYFQNDSSMKFRRTFPVARRGYSASLGQSQSVSERYRPCLEMWSRYLQWKVYRFIPMIKTGINSCIGVRGRRKLQLSFNTVNPISPPLRIKLETLTFDIKEHVVNWVINTGYEPSLPLSASCSCRLASSCPWCLC